MPAATGADTRAVYLWEDTFATDAPADSTYKTFGHDVTVTSAELSNNPTDLFDPGSREATERIAQAFEGSWGVEFTMTNPWFWRAVIAEASSTAVDSDGDGTTDYHEHTFDGEIPDSMRLVLPVESTSNERILKGCVVSSCTVEASDNGTVTVTLEGAYADEEENTGVSLTSQTTPSMDPATYADGELTVSGTTYSLVQSVTLTVENNIDLVPELGSRFAADYSPKPRTTEVDFDKIVEGDSNLLTAYGGSGSSPANRVDGSDEVSGSLTFDTGSESQTLNFAGALPDSYGRSGTGDPEADYLENNTLGARQVDVVAQNNTSTAK